MRPDGAFSGYVTAHLAGLAGVRAVTLGGSRGAGTNRPDSDWDFGVYYRGAFSPDGLRAIGWPGRVFEIGGWGGGVFNGSRPRRPARSPSPPARPRTPCWPRPGSG